MVPTEIQGRDLQQLGVPPDAVGVVQFDRQVARQAMEDKARGNRITMEPPQREICTAPKGEAALRFRWEHLKDVTEVSEVYIWYKHTQESVITFGIPLMPFRGIVLRQKAYGLCIPGMGTYFWTTCGRLMMKILR